MGGQIQKINSTVAQLQGDVTTMEGVLASAEQDRANKDDQIRTLKDEIAHQSDMIGKLSKEKRSVGDSRQKTEEDIQAAEDKCNHLSRVKGKLEQALDEAEDTLAAKYAKQAKELMARIEELDEELNVERGNR